MIINPDEIEAIRSSLKIDPKTRRVMPTLANALTLVSKDPELKGTLRWNELTGRIEYSGPHGKRRSNTLTDNDVRRICLLLEQRYDYPGKKCVGDAIHLTAEDNQFHPIIDFLLSLEWDGKERIRYLFKHFLGAATDDYTYECTKLFLLGAICRVFDPGVKFEQLLCLVGSTQGIGKSSILRLLAHDDNWFSDCIKKLDSENMHECLAGHWIMEAPEMLALYNIKSNEAIKAFLSRQTDSYRTPYETYANDYPRQTVFAGTSNIIHFLPKDRSGNRRFLPILCDETKADVFILDNEEESREYIDQVWAEAMVIYRSGNFKLHLPRQMEKDLAKYQEPFMQEDTWADMINAFLDDYEGKYVCTQLLYCEALGKPNASNMHRSDSNQIMEIMSKRKDWKYYAHNRHVPGYKKQRGWERVSPYPATAQKTAGNRNTSTL